MGTQSSPIRTLPSAPELHRILRHSSLAGYNRRSGISAERLTLPRSLAPVIVVLKPGSVKRGKHQRCHNAPGVSWTPSSKVWPTTIRQTAIPSTERIKSQVMREYVPQTCIFRDSLDISVFFR